MRLKRAFMRIDFTLESYDCVAGISGEIIRDMMVQYVEHRFDTSAHRTNYNG
jgi:hypothetical protein